MNPEAPAFVSTKAKKLATGHPAPVMYTAPQAVVLPTLPSPAAQTKLRAVAVPFEPKGAPAPSVLTNPPPPPPPEYGSGVHTPPAQGKAPLPMDADAAKKLNVSAAPYTPTKLRQSPTSKGTPTFPETPSSATSTPSVGAPPSMSVAAVSSIEAAAMTKAASTSTLDSAPSSPAYIEKPIGDPFAKSKLPVPALVRPAPAEAIKFNCSWALYADDHPQVFGPNEYRPPVVIREVSDLESFWRLWWHCPPPSACTPSWTYYWFRKDVKPEWEDTRNKNGGTMTISVYDQIRSVGKADVVDDVFMQTVLGLSGESIKDSLSVNGIALKLRQGKIMLTIWTNTGEECKLKGIAEGVRTTLDKIIPSKLMEKLEFFSHARQQSAQQSAASKGSFGKGKNAKQARVEPDFTL